MWTIRLLMLGFFGGFLFPADPPVIPTRSALAEMGLLRDGGSIVGVLITDGDQRHALRVDRNLASLTKGRVSLDGVWIDGDPAWEPWVRAALALVSEQQDRQLAHEIIAQLDKQAAGRLAAEAQGPLTPEVATRIALRELHALFGPSIAVIMGTDTPIPTAVLDMGSALTVRFERKAVDDPATTMVMPIIIDKATRRVLGTIGWTESNQEP
jgi:hypothetical protein